MFDRRSPEQERVLNELWNDLVRASGAQDAAEDPLDQELVETIRYLHDLGATPSPTSSRERVRRGLQESASSKSAHKEVDMFAQTEALRPYTIAANGWHPAQPAESRQLRLFERPLAYLAVAAVLLIALGGIAMAYRYGGDSSPSRGGPAIFAPGTPSPNADVDQQTLFEITLPADLVPHTAERHAALAHETVPPGMNSTWTPYTGTGTFIQYIVSGSLVVQVEAEVQILRGDGSSEEIPAGAEATLNAGDALITRLEQAMETTNPGDLPAETLNIVFIDDPGDRFSGRNQRGWKIHAVVTLSDAFGDLVELPGAVTIRLQRLALRPDQRFIPEEGHAHLEVILNPVTESILSARDGSFRATNVTGAPTTTVFYLTLTPDDAESGATQ